MLREVLRHITGRNAPERRRPPRTPDVRKQARGILEKLKQELEEKRSRGVVYKLASTNPGEKSFMLRWDLIEAMRVHTPPTDWESRGVVVTATKSRVTGIAVSIGVGDTDRTEWVDLRDTREYRRFMVARRIQAEELILDPEERAKRLAEPISLETQVRIAVQVAAPHPDYRFTKD